MIRKIENIEYFCDICQKKFSVIELATEHEKQEHTQEELETSRRKHRKNWFNLVKMITDATDEAEKNFRIYRGSDD